MRGPHDNSKAIRYQAIFRNTVECHRCIVHSRTKIISLKTQQQFTHFCIRSRSEVSTFFFKIAFRPTIESPVLIIDKDTSEFDRWCFRDKLIDFYTYLFFLLFYRSIGPPVPGRHTYRFRYGEKSVSSTTPVTSGYDNCFLDARNGIVDHLYHIAFPTSGNGSCIYFISRCQSINPSAFSYSTGNNRIPRRYFSGLAFLHFQLLPRHTTNIIHKKRCTLTYYSCIFSIKANNCIR